MDYDRSIGALLFDLDGVLVDSLPAYRIAWARWAAHHGVDEATIWSNAHGKRPEDIIERVAPDLHLRDALSAFDQTFTAAAGACKSMPGARECLSALPTGGWAS